MKGSQSDAKNYAIKLLSYRSRSKREMLDRLGKKDFDSGHIDSAIKFLEDTGLINDKVLVHDLVRYATETKSLGKRGIRMFLAKRGIEKELIDNTLSTHESETEEKAAVKFVERKLRTMKNYPEDIVRRRLWGMLQRRGFSINIIQKALELLNQKR